MKHEFDHVTYLAHCPAIAPHLFQNKNQHPHCGQEGLKKVISLFSVWHSLLLLLPHDSCDSWLGSHCCLVTRSSGVLSAWEALPPGANMHNSLPTSFRSFLSDSSTPDHPVWNCTPFISTSSLLYPALLFFFFYTSYHFLFYLLKPFIIFCLSSLTRREVSHLWLFCSLIWGGNPPKWK